VLFWIGWYLSGPLAETIDHWDGPRQEIQDILFNAGGGVTLVACAFSLVILQAKKLRESCSLPDHNEGAPIASAMIAPAVAALHLFAVSIHSPPIFLRI